MGVIMAAASGPCAGAGLLRPQTAMTHMPSYSSNHAFRSTRSARPRAANSRSLASTSAISGTRQLLSAGCSISGSGGKSSGRRCVTVRAEEVDFKDRAVAALPYLVPLFDGLRYGKFALASTPFLYTVLSPLDPLLRLYLGVPFASLIVFFGIYLGIINNQEWSRYVRFNAMQAILLDIILILPGLFVNVLGTPSSGFGLTLFVNVYNAIFWFVLVCWIYGTVSCILGRVPRLPLVGDAADQQVR